MMPSGVAMVRDNTKTMEENFMLELCLWLIVLLEWRLQVEPINMVAYCSIFILIKSSPMRLEFLFSGV